MSDCKSAIVNAFRLLQRHETMNKGGFKIKAYRDALAKLDEIKAVTKEADLAPLRGKGKDGGGIYQKALEILTTGTCGKLEELKEDDGTDAFDLFCGIHGIGPAAARSLVDAGYRTIADLRTATATGKLALTKTQAIGLDYCDKGLQERIPQAEMIRHERLLKDCIGAAVRSDIVGSFRRNAPTSGDIDLLLCSDDPRQLDRLVEDLKKLKYVVATLAHGAHKFMGICQLGSQAFRRLDILLTPPEKYGFALLYFTGSQKFNILVRQHALTLGYSLNEHALSIVDKRAKPVPALPTEEHILEFLGLTFVKPADREHVKALIEAPRTGRLDEDEDEDNTCQYCDKEFEYAYDCGVHEKTCKAAVSSNSASSKAASTKKPIVCHMCGNAGHLPAKCPMKRFIDE
jgi:DNA polymerase/3'-5' exonuclease PolX